MTLSNSLITGRRRRAQLVNICENHVNICQDTYIALRALIEYTNRKRLRDVSSLAVSVEAVALSGEPRTLTVRNQDLATLQTVDVSIN